MAASLGELHVAGATIAWDRIIGPGRVGPAADLPVAAQPPLVRVGPRRAIQKGLVRRLRAEGNGSSPRAARRQARSSNADVAAHDPARRSAYLSDHRIQGAVVFPGTGYLEMAMQTLADEDATRRRAARRRVPAVQRRRDRTRAVSRGERYRPASDHTQRRSLGHPFVHGGGRAGFTTLRESAGARPSVDSRPISTSTRSRRAARTACPRTTRIDCSATSAPIRPGIPGDRRALLRRGESLARLEIPPPPWRERWTPGAPRGSCSIRRCSTPVFTRCSARCNLNGEDADRRGNVFLPVGVAAASPLSPPDQPVVEPCPPAQPREPALRSRRSRLRRGPRARRRGPRPAVPGPRAPRRASRRSGSANGCSSTAGETSRAADPWDTHRSMAGAGSRCAS